MAYHVPEEESLDLAGLRALQQRKLAAVLADARAGAFYERKLSGIAFDPASDPITALPLTTRGELENDQRANPPYGSVLTRPLGEYCRYHQTSGTGGHPLRLLDTRDTWQWWKRCWCIIFRAAGVEPEDRIVFPFSFGPFVGFWCAFEAAVDLGNLSLPAGGMTTTARLQYILDNDVTVICCTPTYALRMVEVAQAEGIDIAPSRVRLLIVAGEPGGSLPGLRSAIEQAWNARVIDHAGMTEVGPWGFECVEAPGGIHVTESEFIAEVIDPTTGDVLPEGTTGELVLTNLGRVGWPLIRYRTGDQAALIRNRCACGRCFARIEGGIQGRIDDMIFIRGNNVFPSVIGDILQGIPGIAEYRIRVSPKRALAELNLVVEPSAEAPDSLVQLVTSAVRDRLHFTPLVELASPGTLERFEMKARRVIRDDGEG